MPVVRINGRRTVLVGGEYTAYQKELQREQEAVREYELRKEQQRQELQKQITDLKEQLKVSHLERTNDLPKLREDQEEILASRGTFVYNGTDPFTREDWVAYTNDAYSYTRDIYESWDESPDGMRGAGRCFSHTQTFHVPAGTYWKVPGVQKLFFVAEGKDNWIYPHCTLVAASPDQPWGTDEYQVQLRKQVWEDYNRYLSQMLQRSYERGLTSTVAQLGRNYGNPVMNLVFKLLELEHKADILAGKKSPHSKVPKDITDELLHRLDQELGLV